MSASPSWARARGARGAGAGREVLLWAREPEVVAGIERARENTLFLAGVKLPEAIVASADVADVGGADAVLLAAPAQHVREMLLALKPHVARGTPVVVCAKGIEKGRGSLLPGNL